jgi:hypothetical protein
MYRFTSFHDVKYSPPTMAGKVVQVVKYLSSKFKTLSSNSTTSWS